VKQLMETMDAKQVRRYIFGEWFEIKGDVIYYSYDRDHNYVSQSYRVSEQHPIRLGFDFNIGHGKPMSSVALQYDNREFHFFGEAIVEGARTENILEEWADKGLFDFNTEFVMHGDATGRRRSTNSTHSDWEIVTNFLDRFRNRNGHAIRYRIDVPLTNPKIRERHNIVNGQLHSSTGVRRIKLYDSWIAKDGTKHPGARITDEGLRLTKLKPGANFVEDDSKYYQHCTTALGYSVVAVLNESNSKPIGSFSR
jgi:hypothetical protein